MATTFSSDGADLMQRIVTPVGVGGCPPAVEIEEYYELDRTIAFVLDNNFAKVREYLAVP